MAWARVKWTEAGQITPFMGAPSGDPDEQSQEPKDYFEALLKKKSYHAAVTFLGIALPRYECVTWAARVLEQSNPRGSPRRVHPTVDAVERWIKDPSDTRRRAVWESVGAAEDGSPEKLLGTATFLSGGSMAPEDLPPVLPEPHICGKLAAAAILVAAHRTSDAEKIILAALKSGVELAERGIQ